jgi:VWFA-related protein
MRQVFSIVTVIVAGVASAAVVRSQQPQATFRTSTRLVVQTVTVTDRQGKPIEGLTAEDFVVTEDGQSQQIAFVEFQQLPTEATPAAAEMPEPAAPAAATVTETTRTEISAPPPGSLKYQDRRLIVLYFDLSAMPPFDQSRAYSNALTFIDTRMSRADMVAVLVFGGGAVHVKRDFSDSRATLRETIRALMYGEDRDGDGLPDSPAGGSEFGQNDAEFNVFNTDRQLSALQTAVTMLRPLPEQKTLIYFGSGLRLNGMDNQAQLRATVNAAVRANVTINPIDARGLVATPPLGDAARPSPAGVGVFTGALASQSTTELQRSQDTLFALAKDTGGRAMFDYNDLSLGVMQAAHAVSSYYIVGYYATNTAKDGRFRQVRVALAGNRQAELAFRQGYYADKEFARFTAADKERQLEEALRLEDPVTEIGIAMEVNYFQLNRAEYFVPVAVKIPGSELTLARRRNEKGMLIDLIGEVKDQYGLTIQNVRDKLDIPLDGDAASQLATAFAQYETGFTLLPGRYVIKILARDASTGRIGTYQSTFTIPNLMGEERRLPISSVVLGSQRVALGQELHSVRNASAQDVHPLVADGQKLIPSVTRVFSQRRPLYVFLQAYEHEAESMRPLVAAVAFYRDNIRVLEERAPAVTGGMQGRANAVPLRFSFALERLPPGRYDCQVTVLDPLAQKAAFWRAPIAVVP